MYVYTSIYIYVCVYSYQVSIVVPALGLVLSCPKLCSKFILIELYSLKLSVLKFKRKMWEEEWSEGNDYECMYCHH